MSQSFYFLHIDWKELSKNITSMRVGVFSQMWGYKDDWYSYYYKCTISTSQQLAIPDLNVALNAQWWVWLVFKILSYSLSCFLMGDANRITSPWMFRVNINKVAFAFPECSSDFMPGSLENSDRTRDRGACWLSHCASLTSQIITALTMSYTCKMT